MYTYLIRKRKKIRLSPTDLYVAYYNMNLIELSNLEIKKNNNKCFSSYSNDRCIMSTIYGENKYYLCVVCM